jgi:hypothetical protein
MVLMEFEPLAGFEEQFGVRYPIMLAPMAGFTDGRTAASVTSAGGLGTFGASNPGQPDQWVGEQIDLIRTSSTAPFGVGFITPSLEQRRRRFEIALEKSVMSDTTEGWFRWTTPSGDTTHSQRHGRQRAGPAPPAA